MRARGSVLAASLVATLLVGGCGGGTAGADPLGERPKVLDSSDPVNPKRVKLETIVAEAQRQAESAIGPAIRKKYSSIRVLPRGDEGINYVFTFKDPVDVGKTTAYLDTQKQLFDATFDAQVAPEFKRIGFENPSATWTYLNPSGSLVWTYTAS